MHLVNSNFILTLEGQLVFDLGPRLKKRFVIDNVDYQMPNTEVIKVVSGPVESEKGVMNNNIEEPQFSEICNFVKCNAPEDYCRSPVRPAGHCCDVCGAIITFHHANLNFQKIKSKLELIEEDYFPLSFIAEDGSDFDEDLFLDAAREAYGEVEKLPNDDDTHLRGSLYGYTEVVSEQKGKIRLISVLKILFFLLCIAAVAYFYVKHLQKTSPRFRLWLNSNSRDLQNRVTVMWQNATKMAEDQVNIAFRRASIPSHQRFENESEDTGVESSLFHAEFKNPTFIENQPEDLGDFKSFGSFGNFGNPSDFESSGESESKKANIPEIKKEIKEENFINLEF
ncbi:hypothetical protein FO519_001201 [Halicephalobus sp. NKZ332]|nr:hypothetical protein FO519_001201 [Halicephalobus sp. NKZ332]